MLKSWMLGIALMPALLISCVSSPQTMASKPAPDVLQRRVQTWLGMPRDFLEKHWGVANSTKDMGLGLRYLQYRPKVAKKKAKDPGLCTVTFTVDITGTVKGGQWSGDRSSCLGFVKEVPSGVKKHQLVSL
jgi:hypothetical protein